MQYSTPALLAVVLRDDKGSSRQFYLDTTVQPPVVGEGQPPRLATATLNTTFDTLWRIGAGQLKIMAATLRGLLKLEGDRSIFMQHMVYFRPAFEALKYVHKSPGR